ncbi:PEX8 Peroxisomal biogenesis factor 8 [Candida maltosa Xu316]
MSNLYQKLGPQGRALLNNKGLSTGSNFQGSNVAPQELDFLINELRNPSPELSVNKVLGYLYNYLPYIKHEHNLRLVIASFLNTPVCFGNNVNFEENYLIIEVFKLLFDKKLKVSIPTLSIKTFYTVLLKELKHFQSYNPPANSWKILPIISGVLLSNPTRDELYTNENFIEYKWFFQNWDNEATELFGKAFKYSLSNSFSNNINYLSLISLALVFKKNENVVEKYSEKVSSHLIINQLMQMIFLDPLVSISVYEKFFQLNVNNPNVEKVVQTEILNKPVVKHLNKLSFLLEAYFGLLGFSEPDDDLVRTSLTSITQFNKVLNFTTNNSIFNDFNGSKQSNPLIQSFWFFMKTLLFSETIVFQGILTRFLTANTKFGNSIFWFGRRDLTRIEMQYKNIALELIPNLYYINFILLSIGQGGFDNYNFVYYLTIELSLATGIRFEKNTMYLIANYQEVNMHPDVLNQNYVTTSKILFVLGLWENYLQSPYRQPGYCQEIYDIAINLADSSKYSNDDLLEASHSVLLFYFANSDHIDIPNVTKYVELLLDQFPQRLSATQLSIAIETIGKKIFSNPINYQQSPSVFSNSGIVSLINLIPYFPLSVFINWLNKIWDLITRSDIQEQKFLVGMLWKVISDSLDLNRMELAVNWWYEDKGFSQQLKLTSKI